MIKIILLCAIIAIGYVQSTPLILSNSDDTKIDLPSMETKKLDADNKYQMKSLGSLDSYDVITAESSKKPKNMNTYYTWLNFLHTSTSTATNNVTVPETNNATVQEQNHE